MKLVAIIIILLVAVLIIIFGVGAYGVFNWRNKTDSVRSAMRADRVQGVPKKYDRQQIKDLPVPVQRYFHTALQDGQPIITGVRIVQRGQLRMGEAENSWRPFSATQFVTPYPPAFDWDARIKIVPGMTAFVRDAYHRKTGILHATLFGLITIASQRNIPEMAQSELMRYLAESPWYPTALLPGYGVEWEPLTDTSARATLTDGNVSATVEFHFNEEGLIASIYSPSRYREVNRIFKPTPWEGRFNSYTRQNGMLVPLEGEVEWHLPEGRLPYWRGRIIEIEFEFFNDQN